MGLMVGSLNEKGLNKAKGAGLSGHILLCLYSELMKAKSEIKRGAPVAFTNIYIHAHIYFLLIYIYIDDVIR